MYHLTPEGGWGWVWVISKKKSSKHAYTENNHCRKTNSRTFSEPNKHFTRTLIFFLHERVKKKLVPVLNPSKIKWEFTSKWELLATFKWKMKTAVIYMLIVLLSRWSCRYKVCGQRNSTERKTATARGMSVVLLWFLFGLCPMSMVIIIVYLFQEQEKKRKQKEEAKKKLEAEKVWKNDIHLPIAIVEKLSL